MITLSAVSTAIPPIRHAFFTRQGGVSDGMFASLNCGFGSGDDPRPGRAEPGDRGGPARAWRPIGWSAATRCTAPPRSPSSGRGGARNNPRADGMVTAVPGIALGVLAADCAPVLFADPEARVIGAAHGGWRGALAGVMEATVAAMTALGARPERIRAGIGPCIAQPSYEVGPEFEARFAAEDPDSGGFFRPAPRPGHFLFDLPGYIAHRLARLGLAAVERSAARHRRRGGPVLQLSARLPARRSRLRPRPRRDRAGGIGRAMPYLVMFAVFCLLGLLATCAML